MKTIRSIKNILIIVCLSFSILTSISKCNAYTFEEFGEFLDYCVTNQITSSVCSSSQLSRFKHDYDIIKNNNYDFSAYNSFFFMQFSGNNDTFMYAVNISNFGTNTSNYMDINVINGKVVDTTQYGYVYSVYNSATGWVNNMRIGLVGNTIPDNFNWHNFVGQQRWNRIPPFSFTPYGILASGDWYYQKFSYTGNICLGELGNNTFYQLDIKLKNPNGVQLGVISIVPDVRYH